MFNTRLSVWVWQRGLYLSFPKESGKSNTAARLVNSLCRSVLSPSYQPLLLVFYHKREES